MKNKTLFEEIILDMHNSEKIMTSSIDVVADDNIIKKLEEIPNIEQVDRDGRSLLVNAICYERLAIVKYLKNRGADMNSKDKLGFTPLHIAVQTGNIELIRYVLENGGDINARNFFGNIPLMMATPTMEDEVFSMLINYGSNPYQKNKFGISALEQFSAYSTIVSILSCAKF